MQHIVFNPARRLRQPYQALGARLSPDGKHIAFKYPEKDRMDILVLNLDTTESMRLKGQDSEDVNSIYWNSNEHVLFNVLKSNKYAHGLYAIKAGTRRINLLNKHDAVRVIDPVPSDPKRALVRITGSDRGARTLIYDPASGYAKRDKSANDLPGIQSAWYSDGLGNLKAVNTYTEKEHQIYYKDSNDAWVRLGDVANTVHDEFEVYTYDRHHNALWIGAYEEGNNTASLFRVSLDTPDQSEKIFNDPNYDIWDNSSLIQSRATGAVLGIKYSQKGPATHWLDPKMYAIQKALNRTFPNETHNIVDISTDQTVSFFTPTATFRQPSVV